jgi:hypothetical protein
MNNKAKRSGAEKTEDQPERRVRVTERDRSKYIKKTSLLEKTVKLKGKKKINLTQLKSKKVKENQKKV